MNDYILHRSIFAETLKKVAEEERKLVFCLKELILNQITEPAYREHVEHNFEDKIFFFEPVNKFFDLVEVQ